MRDKTKHIAIIQNLLLLTMQPLSRVPGTPDPSGLSVILDRDAFAKIRGRSNVLSDAEKKAQAKTVKENKTTKLDAMNARKQEMQELELTRKRNEKPSDLEQVKTKTINITLVC